MTPRERFFATLNHQKPDHVMIELYCRPEIMEQLRRHYGVQSDVEVEAILGADNVRGAGTKVRWKDYESRINGQLHGNAAVMHDDRTFEDPWGVVQRLGSDGKYLEWVSGPFVNTDDLDSFAWPDEACLMDDPSLPDKIARYKKDGYVVVGSGGVHPFKQAWHMRGFENFLCDYMANPAWVEAFYERILRLNLAMCRRSAQLGADLIEYWGDVAMQDRMIVPPDRWRELDKPMWKTIITETRKVNPDVKFFFHSDGDVSPIIGDIIEVGFDILNPIQPECVNPAKIKAQWGKRITLDGGGSVQRTIPFGTIDDVRREVEFLLTTCAYDGGYILRPSNMVPYDNPIRNVIAFFEAARDFDLSKLQGPPSHIPDPPCMSITKFTAPAGQPD